MIMQKTNLLYVITKLELGGAQKQLISLIDRLDKKRYNISLFTARTGFLLSDVSSRNDISVYTSRFLERPISPLGDLIALCEIYRLVRQQRVDIIHTHSSKAGILGRLAAGLAGVKAIVHTVHGWSFNDYQPQVLRLLYIWLERFTARFTQCIIVLSECDKQKGLSHRIGKNDAYRIIPCAIDYSEFCHTDDTVRQELGIGADESVIGMVSCLKSQKAPQDFIKLARITIDMLKPHTQHKGPRNGTCRQNSLKFILVGDGILRNDIQRLIRMHNVKKHVILTGWRRDIPRLLSCFDVFVLTSLWEGLPVTALEAMASSKPVIVTDTGGIAECIKDGYNGFLVAAGHIEEMAQKLICLLNDDTLRKRMGSAAKASLNEKCSIDHMVAVTEKIYEGCLGERNNAYTA